MPLCPPRAGKKPGGVSADVALVMESQKCARLVEGSADVSTAGSEEPLELRYKKKNNQVAYPRCDVTIVLLCQAAEAFACVYEHPPRTV